MKKILILIVIVAALLLAYYLIYQKPTPDEEVMEAMGSEQMTRDIRKLPGTTEMMQEAMEMEYQYSGKLKDVTGGNASGVAKSGVFDSEYQMLATFENLPELDPGYFYEGWVVRKIPFDFISTGVLTREDGQWMNLYMSSDTSLVDHDFYVLTLEPDDGDPAPAAHVLEGTMR